MARLTLMPLKPQKSTWVFSPTHFEVPWSIAEGIITDQTGRWGDNTWARHWKIWKGRHQAAWGLGLVFAVPGAVVRKLQHFTTSWVHGERFHQIWDAIQHLWCQIWTSLQHLDAHSWHTTSKVYIWFLIVRRQEGNFELDHLELDGISMSQSPRSKPIWRFEAAIGVPSHLVMAREGTQPQLLILDILAPRTALIWSLIQDYRHQPTDICWIALNHKPGSFCWLLNRGRCL